MRIFIFLLFFSAPLLAHFPLKCSGCTQINYINQDELKNHSITSFEDVEIDLDQNYLQCLNQTHDSLKQLHYEDSDSEIYADQMQAFYHQVNGRVQLKTLKIYGNVSIIYKNSPQESEAGLIKNQALADQLTLDYEKNQITLVAKENSKVLFYDPNNHMRIAADEVWIEKKQGMQDPLIQGIGKVRFLFEENELKRFTNRFPTLKGL